MTEASQISGVKNKENKAAQNKKHGVNLNNKHSLLFLFFNSQEA